MYPPLGPPIPMPGNPKMGVLYQHPTDGEIGYYGELGRWIPLNKVTTPIPMDALRVEEVLLDRELIEERDV
jgi:hypothetical protein